MTARKHFSPVRKRFGQHFLSDTQVLDKIAAAVSVSTNDHIFEIGPGHGALTDLLIDGAQRYLAVEIDRDLIPLLRARHPRLQLVNDDILNCELSALLLPTTSTTTQQVGWRVVGNLPYNISSAVLIKLQALVQQHPGLIRDVHFMLQKEMADRLCASPGSKSWGRLSVLIQLFFAHEMLFDVAPESFSPAPRVNSSVIRLSPKQQTPAGDVVVALQQVLRLAFSGRRKRLSNSLQQLGLDWAKVAAELSLNPGERADNVSKEQFLGLARLAAPQLSKGI